MYAITNDYFDSFSAIFGPKECLLNGKRTHMDILRWRRWRWTGGFCGA